MNSKNVTSQVQCKGIEIVVALLRDGHSSVLQRIKESGIIEGCLNVLFGSEWNNCIHTSVEHILQMILSSGGSRYEARSVRLADAYGALQRSLLIDAQVLRRIIDTFARSNEYKESGKRQHIGIIGHLTRISNTIMRYAGDRDALAKLVEEAAAATGLAMALPVTESSGDTGTEKRGDYKNDWERFVAIELTEMNERLNKQLAADGSGGRGARPKPSLYASLMTAMSKAPVPSPFMGGGDSGASESGIGGESGGKGDLTTMVDELDIGRVSDLTGDETIAAPASDYTATSKEVYVCKLFE